MANYANLKAALNAAIYTNTQRAITGDVLNAKMDEMIDALGAGYQYMGEATPSINPGTPDCNVVYLAATAGTYPTFGGLTLASGKIAFFRWNGTWQKDEISVQAELTVDPAPTSGSSNPVASGGVFTALQGKQPTINTIDVSVDNNTGTPSATASMSGDTMTMAFHNIKGATGPQGPKGDQGDPGSSIDYPFTLVNNLNSTDSTKALAAPQGKVLAQDLSDFKLLVKANINTLMNAMANMAFTGERPTLDWGSLDAHVIRDFTNPSGITLTDNSVGGLISFGTAYSGTLSANSGYVLSNVSVTMAGGGTITYNSTTGAIASSSVTGDITIVATATFDYNSLGYTQSGLVFALDGIYKGGNANAWTDLIGGEVFENHGAVANANHWAFDGTDDYLGGWGETELDFDPADCTIEVAFRSDSSSVQGAGFICHLANQRTSTLNCVHVNVIPGYINGVYLNGTSNVWAWSYITTNCVLALNGARGYANSTALSSLGSNHWTGNYQGRYIGTTTDYTKSTPTFNKGFFRGEIYAIRIYNRQLTEAEMRADQANDNTRFNLGVSL